MYFAAAKQQCRTPHPELTGQAAEEDARIGQTFAHPHSLTLRLRRKTERLKDEVSHVGAKIAAGTMRPTVLDD